MDTLNIPAFSVRWRTAHRAVVSYTYIESNTERGLDAPEIREPFCSIALSYCLPYQESWLVRQGHTPSVIQDSPVDVLCHASSYGAGLIEMVKKMSTDYPSTIIVIYHCSVRDWYFAEVDPEASIYRFGPFDSEIAIHDVLTVIYLDTPQLEIIDAPGEYDDATILRTARCAAPPILHGPAEQGGQGTAISWWTLRFNRRRPARASRGALGPSS